MNYNYLRISEKITLSRETIQNALNDAELAEPLAEFGFTPEKLSEGLAIQENVQSLQVNRVAEFGQRMEATRKANELFSRVYDTYLTDRRILFRRLKDRPGLLERLGASRPVDKRKDVFLFNVQSFYQELKDNEEIRSFVELYNFMPEVLDDRLADVSALADAMHEQQLQSGIAQVATQRRREAIATLDDWMLRFIGAARLAFRQDKKQLEKLGIRSR